MLNGQLNISCLDAVAGPKRDLHKWISLNISVIREKWAKTDKLQVIIAKFLLAAELWDVLAYSPAWFLNVGSLFWQITQQFKNLLYFLRTTELLFKFLKKA